LARIRGNHANESRTYSCNWLAVAALVTAGGVAHAQLTEADIGVNPTFEQTDATTVNSTGRFLFRPRVRDQCK